MTGDRLSIKKITTSEGKRHRTSNDINCLSSRTRTVRTHAQTHTVTHANWLLQQAEYSIFLSPTPLRTKEYKKENGYHLVPTCHLVNSANPSKQGLQWLNMMNGHSLQLITQMVGHLTAAQQNSSSFFITGAVEVNASRDRMALWIAIGPSDVAFACRIGRLIWRETWDQTEFLLQEVDLGFLFYCVRIKSCAIILTRAFDFN